MADGTGSDEAQAPAVSTARLVAAIAGSAVIAVVVAVIFPTGRHLWFVAPSACSLLLGGGIGLTCGRHMALACALLSAILTLTLRWMGYEASQPFPIS